jgi:diketogulonate reductase-like aldo/keto reductase
MEYIHGEGGTTFLGVSNVSPDQLEALLAGARVRPTFVQNRCYASRGWDAAVRAVCDREGLVYQAFSLLTANREIIQHPFVRDIARRHERTPAQIVFRFALQVGMIPLTGTTDRHHMDEALAAYDLELSAQETRAIEHAEGLTAR